MTLCLSVLQMSQIRRLCRLLVDCDGNVAPKNESGEGSKFKGASSKGDKQAEPTLSPGSGTMALARCWREIVESEVSVVSVKLRLHHYDCSNVHYVIMC